VGESFVAAEEDQAASYLEKLREEINNNLENKAEELEGLKMEMKNLKTFLYARFGSAINLEEDEWKGQLLRAQFTFKFNFQTNTLLIV